MTGGDVIGKVKEIVFKAYPHVWDFDIGGASNGGDELKVIVKLKTSIGQVLPIRIKVILKKSNPSDYRIEKIYETKAEKKWALKDNGRVDAFLTDFSGTEVTDDDVDRFKEDNKDILEYGEIRFRDDEIKQLLELRRAQMQQ